MNSIAEKYIRKETLPFIFCPGCGHGIVVNAFLRVLDKLNIGENEMGLVSGIGCSSWAPVYIDMDCLHTLHGRALAQAEGLKAVNPDKKVVVFSGDGDCAGIGGNHLIHAAKRNVDITVIMMSNYIYAASAPLPLPTAPSPRPLLSATRSTPSTCTSSSPAQALPTMPEPASLIPSSSRRP